MRALVFLVLTAWGGAYAQTSDPQAFLRYLMAKRFFDEAILEAQRLQKLQPADDNVSFLLGFAHYEKQSMAASIAAWDNLAPTSGFFVPAQFYKGYAQVFSGQPTAGVTTFQNIVPADSLLAALQALELAGTGLLQHDFNAFERHAKTFGRQAVLQKHEQNLQAYATLLQKRVRKPWKAGMLQLVLPGAGYFYAGYKGHAIYNLLMSALLGLQAREGYQRSGAGSARFIAYASAFAVLHVATIWGSTLAVKIRRDEREKTIHDQILIDMHIPIRAVVR